MIKREEAISLPELPEAFLNKMEGLLGSQWEAFRASYEETPRLGLRINPLKGNAGQLLARQLFSLEPVPWAEGGFYYGAGERPGKHPFHEAGVYYLQEPSAMAVAGLLAPRPGERVLDLCAAPGGKTTQIGGMMEGRGLLVSNEIHSGRAKILSQNVERMGLRNCVVTNEEPEKLAGRFQGFFDKILVDAPCSGEGMFRKDPKTREQWSLENVARCAARQQEILEWAGQMLAPGGVMVYSTCTFSPEEDEGTVCRFLERHPEYSIAEPEGYPGFSHGNPAWIPGHDPAAARTIRLWPHLLEGEGHFAAVLRKEGPDRGQAGEDGGRKDWACPAIPARKLPAEFTGFCREALNTALPERYLAFGDHLYLFPEGMPRLDGLRVLRPGLELGEIKKKRFEPAHALALALKPEDFRRQVRIPLEDQRGFAYLRGESIPAQMEKGWCAVCTEDYTIGWGKSDGRQLKNHYPRGLRWPAG